MPGTAVSIFHGLTHFCFTERSTVFTGQNSPFPVTFGAEIHGQSPAGMKKPELEQRSIQSRGLCRLLAGLLALGCLCSVPHNPVLQ